MVKEIPFNKELEAARDNKCPLCGQDMYTATVTLSDDLRKVTIDFECTECEYALEIENSGISWKKVSSRP